MAPESIRQSTSRRPFSSNAFFTRTVTVVNPHRPRSYRRSAPAASHRDRQVIKVKLLSVPYCACPSFSIKESSSLAATPFLPPPDCILRNLRATLVRSRISSKSLFSILRYERGTLSVPPRTSDLRTKRRMRANAASRSFAHRSRSVRSCFGSSFGCRREIIFITVPRDSPVSTQCQKQLAPILFCSNMVHTLVDYPPDLKTAPGVRHATLLELKFITEVKHQL